MPRRRATQGSKSQHKTSATLPLGSQTSQGLSEEFTFSDYPDSFFTDGKIKSLQGTSNILIVAPNMSPDTLDKNIGLLTCELAEALGAYAVVNCGCYRSPVEGDPNSEALQLSHSPSPTKEDKRILKLRQRLLDETGGIPVNLDSFNSASTAAYEYVEGVWLTAGEIGYRAIPLAFFLYGIDDATADQYLLDIAVGAGYLLDEKEQSYAKDTATADRAFVEELLGGLGRLRNGVRVGEGVEGYALAGGGEVAGWLRYNWNDQYDPSEDDEWRAEDTYSVVLGIRYNGFRDNEENLRRTVEELAHEISGLSLFKSWQEEKMAKNETKKAKKPKAEKGTPSAPGKTTAVDEQPSEVVVVDAMTSQPAGLAPVGVILISQEKFQEKIESLQGLTTIKNDKGEEVAFGGEAKEVFIAAFEQGYPVIGRALASIYELGGFLSDVRDKLKSHRLYYSWLDYAGIPERTASNYVQVYERYAESLPKFAYLGIKKLITASRLKDCVQYVEQNEETIAEQSADELNKAVKALRATKKTAGTGRGRRPTWIPVGKCRIRPSLDGTKLVIEGLTEKKQTQLIEAIKTLLS